MTLCGRGLDPPPAPLSGIRGTGGAHDGAPARRQSPPPHSQHHNPLRSQSAAQEPQDIGDRPAAAQTEDFGAPYKRRLALEGMTMLMLRMMLILMLMMILYKYIHAIIYILRYAVRPRSPPGGVQSTGVIPCSERCLNHPGSGRTPVSTIQNHFTPIYIYSRSMIWHPGKIVTVG